MMNTDIYLLSSSSPVAKNMKISFSVQLGKEEIIKTINISKEGSPIEAEYIGLIYIFEKIFAEKKIKKLTDVNIFTNNLTVAMQINGKFRVSSNRVIALYSRFKASSSHYRLNAQYLEKNKIRENIRNEDSVYSEKELTKILNEIDSEESIWK